MPSPLNTPTSESIPISIFDIDLEEKSRPRSPPTSQQSELKMVGSGGHELKPATPPLQTAPAAVAATLSPTSSSEDFFSRLGAESRSESCGVFSSASSGSTSSDLSTSPVPPPVVVATEEATIKENANESTEAADLVTAMNGLKTNLSFNDQQAKPLQQPQLPMATPQLNATGSIRFRRARLHLQLAVTSPTPTELPNGSGASGYGRQSVDSMDSASSSSGYSGSTSGVSLDQSTASTESINAEGRAISPSGPRSAPIPLSLCTALTIDCSQPVPPPGDVPLFQRRKRPVFNFFLNKSLGLVDQSNIQIDTSLPLERQSWFHGFISRRDAERLLRKQPTGSFLVRRCEQRHNQFSVALRSYKGFMHIRILENVTTPGRYTLGPNCSEYFDSIPLLIDHFLLRNLPILGAEFMQMMHPVEAQLL